MALRLAPPIEANLINYLWPALIVLLSALLLKGHSLTWRHALGGQRLHGTHLAAMARIVGGAVFGKAAAY